jgi:peptidase E
MTTNKGIIALMGSGELTSTMVEVHKEIIARLGGDPVCSFLDTPAGFQLNADQLSQKAVEYFRSRVQRRLSVVSYKSMDISVLAKEKAFQALRRSDYILFGPGSPTYTVEHLKNSIIPEIITKRIQSGACLIAASAAALTVGRFTMPVYEIYKVGQQPHWVEGLNILGSFGLDLAVIPHWNNAEGGNHDTRRCFIGDSRFSYLANLLPEDVGIIGLDEHTACILDLGRRSAEIRGIGTVTVRRNGFEKIFKRGESFPLDVLNNAGTATILAEATPATVSLEHISPPREKDAFWENIHALEESFHRGLDGDVKEAATAILEVDRVIWAAHQGLESVESITQARDLLREMIVLIGTRLASEPSIKEPCLSLLVEHLIELRNTFRNNKQWKESDAIRDCIMRAGITIEDTAGGTRWKLSS